MSETNKDLTNAIDSLKKKYGESVIMSDGDVSRGIETISTGLYSLDHVLGSGLPRGRIIEVFGEPSSGKTSLSLFIVGQIQKNGGKCVFIDAEYAFDQKHSESLGVDTKSLIVSQPETLEEAAEIIHALAITNAVDVIVVDSVAALTPKKELEGTELLKDSIAEQARQLSKALRLLKGVVSKSKTTVIFINQLRDQVGIFFGDKKVTPGGKALKFYSSIRLEVKRGTKISSADDTEVIGNIIKIKAVKNKVGFPWRESEIELFYKEGVDLCVDTLQKALEVNVIKKHGNTYSYNEDKLGVGIKQAVGTLRDNSSLYTRIREDIDARIAEIANGANEHIAEKGSEEEDVE